MYPSSRHNVFGPGACVLRVYYILGIATSVNSCVLCVPILTHLYLCILVYNTFVNYMYIIYIHFVYLCIISVYTRVSCVLHSTMHALRILYTVYTVTVFVIGLKSSHISVSMGINA